MAGGVTSNFVRALAVLAAVGIAVAIGTGRIARGPENERPEKRETVAGFTTYAVPSAEFSIAVSESWRTFTAEEVFADSAGLDEFIRENPDLAPYRDMLSDPRSPVKLIAADPNIRGNFATTMNVIVNDAPDGYSFDDFVRDSEPQIKSLAGMARDVKSEVVELPAGKAQRLSFDGHITLGGQERSIATLQYGLVANGRAYILTYTTLPEFEADYRDDFERSAQSFAPTG
jgi:hypothetical protein